MDNRLKFLYCRMMFDRSRDTEGRAKHTAGRVCTSAIDRPVVKYAGCFESVTCRENKYRSGKAMLARKAAMKS